MVSSQVTALLGKTPDEKLGLDHVFSWKAPVLKREVAGIGGCGLAVRQGLLLHICPAHPPS